MLRRQSKIIRDIDAVYHDVAVSIGLPDSALLILYYIYTECENFTCPVHEIYKEISLPKQTVCSAMKKLSNLNILAEDESQKYVRLSDYGVKYVNANIKPLADAEKSVLNEWSEGDLQKYIELNLKFFNQFKERTKKLYEKE